MVMTNCVSNAMGDMLLQALRRQLARRPRGEPQVQRGRGQGHIEGRLSALVQRSQVPTAEHRQITQGGYRVWGGVQRTQVPTAEHRQTA